MSLAISHGSYVISWWNSEKLHLQPTKEVAGNLPGCGREHVEKAAARRTKMCCRVIKVVQKKSLMSLVYAEDLSEAPCYSRVSNHLGHNASATHLQTLLTLRQEIQLTTFQKWSHHILTLLRDLEEPWDIGGWRPLSSCAIWVPLY